MVHGALVYRDKPDSLPLWHFRSATRRLQRLPKLAVFLRLLVHSIHLAGRRVLLLIYGVFGVSITQPRYRLLSCDMSRELSSSSFA